MMETPICLQHPLFMLELLSLLSTAIVWIVTLPIFLYNLMKGKISKTRSITQNLFVVSLALATIIVAISGSIFFSKTIPYRPSQIDGRWVSYFDPPDPFGQVYGLGVLFCEGLWIVWTIFIDGPERLGKRAREQKFVDVRDNPKMELPDGAIVILLPEGGCITAMEEVLDYEKFKEAISKVHAPN